MSPVTKLSCKNVELSYVVAAAKNCRADDPELLLAALYLIDSAVGSKVEYSLDEGATNLFTS
jgi:hypothetical protein